MTAVTRSSPMPVSMDGAGSAFKTPSLCRSNSMNTLFQISMYRSQEHSRPRHPPVRSSSHPISGPR
jgi:hypothetical protein